MNKLENLIATIGTEMKVAADTAMYYVLYEDSTKYLPKVLGNDIFDMLHLNAACELLIQNPQAAPLLPEEDVTTMKAFAGQLTSEDPVVERIADFCRNPIRRSLQKVIDLCKEYENTEEEDDDLY